MAVENWIDEIAKLWEISDGAGGIVRSYRLYEKAEFPAAITQLPAVLTYPTGVTGIYGGPSVELWDGVSEFHLALDSDNGRIPDILLYFARIRNAALANITLSSKVSYFQLRNEGGVSIAGPLTLKFGGDEPHKGLAVYWRVKENVNVSIS